MFVFDYLLSVFTQYYVYSIHYDVTNFYRVVKRRSFQQKKRKSSKDLNEICDDSMTFFLCEGKFGGLTFRVLTTFHTETCL